MAKKPAGRASKAVKKVQPLPAKSLNARNARGIRGGQDPEPEVKKGGTGGPFVKIKILPFG